jgi:perosamine synthetase
MKIPTLCVRRELNLYFPAMSMVDAALLLSGALKALVAGNSGPGRWAKALETSWASRFGADEAILFPSARSGLYSLLKAFDVAPGDEVIVTGFTCSAVPSAILQAGAIPVYADINPSTFNMEPDHVRELVNDRTRVLLVQHTYGIAAEVKQLMEIAKDHGLRVIEDACLATGSDNEDRPLGSFGDAAIFSLELSKTLSAGWGGIAQIGNVPVGEALRNTRDEAGPLHRWEASRRLTQAGLSFFLYHPNLFWLSKYMLAVLFRLGFFRYSTSAEESYGHLPAEFLSSPSDSHWRIVARQLQRLEKILDNSDSVANRYKEVLAAHDVNAGAAVENSGYMHLIRFPLLVLNQNRMIEYFDHRGIEIGRWFDAPVAPMPQDPNIFHYTPGQCPVAEEVAQHIVNLPLHIRLTNTDVDKICLVLDSYLRQYPEECEYSSKYLARHINLP